MVSKTRSRSRSAAGDGSSAKGPEVALRLTWPVLREIRRTIGRRPAEQGGMLGGDPATGLITHFHFDSAARRTGATYSPDTTAINALLRDEWNPAGIRLLGFAHSHPSGIWRPSGGDLRYAEAILRAVPDLEQLYLPIVQTVPDTRQFHLYPFAAVRTEQDTRIVPAQLCVEVPAHQRPRPVTPSLSTATFDRVRDAYDLPRMARCRVIYVGLGGAAAFAEDLARAGVGEHILIDPDVVSESNIATQQVYRRDLGRPKVEAVADRLRDINPQAVVVARQEPLDVIDDATFAKLAFEPLGSERPVATLLCGLTDQFDPQARINRLGLQFGLPTLCAQVYREGRGAEITFTYPGVAPACHRCILRSRYDAYLKEGFNNDVTSRGTPIFATTRLNALKGFIALALLHHGMLPSNFVLHGGTGIPLKPSYERWGELLTRIGNRNLLQIRMDPDLGKTLGLGVFERVFGNADHDRVLFDEAVWLPQQPEGPLSGTTLCPDCGGSGDLREAVGTFEDTRVMQRS